MKHGTRAHSKFSASGSERWFNCPGSVALSEGLPDKSNAWSVEGTQAHEVLESILRIELSGNDGSDIEERGPIIDRAPLDMQGHCQRAANFILKLGAKTDSEILVESRVYLDFIHPEMFGTLDSAVLDHFGTLHVLDYKYGVGHVSPKENLQMIFYGIALAHKYQWNFSKVRLWIIQPRTKGYDGPLFWELPILELKSWVPKFKTAVERVGWQPDKYVEGSHCHWCKAKSICPIKVKAKQDEARSIFGPIKKENYEKEEKAKINKALAPQESWESKGKTKNEKEDWAYEV